MIERAALRENLSSGFPTRSEIPVFGSRGIVLSVLTKALMSCAVTAQLIFACVFAYAKSMFFMSRLLNLD